MKKSRLRRYRTTKSKIRKMRRRTKYIGTIAKSKKVSEVKLLSYYDKDKALVNNNFASATASLAGGSNYLVDLLNRITKGVEPNQRVGERIYVKYIDFKLLISQCYDQDAWLPLCSLFRIFVHTNRTTAGSDIVNFFRGTSTKPITHVHPDRRNNNIYHDTTHIFNSVSGVYPYHPGQTTDVNTPMRYIKFRVPIGRQVQYDFNGNTKEDRDCISLAVAGWAPPDAQSRSGIKVGCMDYSARVYYTDL